MQASPETLHRSVYRFGSLLTGLYGYMTLTPDGRVGSYVHPNEHFYEARQDGLRLISRDGKLKRDLLEIAPNTFLEDDKFQHFVTPVATLGAPAHAPDRPVVLVNSIPKAGTYLGELLFKKIGFTSLKVHLSSDAFHDNRDVPEADIHVAPHERRVDSPSSALVSVMCPGEVAVGHIDSFDQIAAIAEQKRVVVNLVRDLRDVLVSLYRFKLATVRPINAVDQWWRQLREPQRFIAFLSYHLDKDIAFMKNVAACILDTSALTPSTMMIRFEELNSGSLSDRTKEKLITAFGPDCTEQIVQTLPAVLGQQTPTITDKRSSHAQYWDADVQSFFEASGLSALNTRLGYDA